MTQIDGKVVERLNQDNVESWLSNRGHIISGIRI